MATTFLSTLPAGIPVIKKAAERTFGDVDPDSPPKAVGHTTEGTSLPTYREGMTDAPTFTVGPKRVWQHRPLGAVCGTLENRAGGVQTNRLVRLQVEIIGFSTRKAWLPRASFQRDALAAIKELAATELDVPRGHVWPDVQEDGVLATTRYARRASRFPAKAGWYGHVEIPENEHWDWGSLLWEQIGDDPADMVDAMAFVKRVKRPDGTRTTEEISPFFATKQALRAWAVVPDGANADTEDDLRASFFDALCANHVWVAHRKVRPEEVRG